MQQPGLNERGDRAGGAGARPQHGDGARTLAIVRRARMLFWQLAGTALLVRHGMSTRRILQDRELQSGRAAAGR